MQRLFDIYMETGLLGCSDQNRREARRKLQRWIDFLGAEREVDSLSPTDARPSTESRLSTVKALGRKPLSLTTLWHDFVALNTALNWLVGYSDAKGRRLLKVNPLNGVSLPEAVSPAQPVANEALYAALKQVAPQIGRPFDLALDLAYATGHRIGAILTFVGRISASSRPSIPLTAQSTGAKNMTRSQTIMFFR